jgi:hypothetical protein
MFLSGKLGSVSKITIDYIDAKFTFECTVREEESKPESEPTKKKTNEKK